MENAQEDMKCLRDCQRFITAVIHAKYFQKQMV